MIGNRNTTIGIWVYEEPWGLQRTLDSIQLFTPSPAFDLVLLVDGPDPATSDALARLGHIPQSVTEHPLGGAACFNRLITLNDSDVFIFLESGTTVTTGWLERILLALDANPANGLAGPSTNRSENEQCVGSNQDNGLPEILRNGERVARQFGNSWRTLPARYQESQYSLSDFCYVVKRDVIDAIGRANEVCQPGLGWETDYNLRAERAGYSGIWVCGAYVHRAPFPPRRERAEAVLAESLANSEPGAWPLISCIMPTRDRREYVEQSIRYFQRQDYPNLELIILDDGGENISSQLPDDPRIRYSHASPGMSIGSKRNQACQLARGEIVAHWDDDDWYSPDRLSAQVAPLLAGSAEISALQETVFFDLPRWEFWTCTRGMHRRLFVEDVHGGTLVYLKRVWEELAQYPDQSLAEDARFLTLAIAAGARLAGLPNQGRFIYLRHGENTWSFSCGQFLDPHGWQSIAEPRLQTSDREFYAAHSLAAPPIAANLLGQSGTRSEVMVSCIMPTAGRRNFLPQAIQYFMRQDYPNRELIIVDDGDDSIADLVPNSPLVRYLRLDRKQSIGAKRNIACENARGKIIVHWDDDDWMAPWRISFQVEKLLGQDADICGISNPLFYNLEDDQAWQYVYPENEKPWVYGATFCYTRSLWERNNFLDTGRGEDTKFVWSEPPKKVLALPNTNMFVGLIHRSNADGNKRPGNSRWHPHSIADIQTILQGDWEYYRNFRLATPGKSV